MGKYDSRINSLIKRTHGFVSHENFCAIRHYFQQRFELEEKPNDFDEAVRELESVFVQLRQDEDPDLRARFQELISVPAIWLKVMIPGLTESCKKFPQGAWLPRSSADWYHHYADDARTYFRDRNEKE